MRVIDADALLKKAHYRETGDLNGEYVLFPSDVEAAPTVDAVPVVRCKDCVHYSLHDTAGGRYCEILRNESPIESGYCCYGERKNK